MRIRARRILLLAGIVAAGVAVATSAPHRADAFFRRPVPEIDPSAVGSTLALVAGCVVVLTDRRRRR